MQKRRAMSAKDVRRRGTAPVLVALTGVWVAGVHPGSAGAQLRSVTQTIHGMDCAPCAYAVERRLKALDGSPSVRLSLNDGIAQVRFQQERHGASLEEIRRSVREGGFGAVEARVEVRGRLRREGSDLLLRAESGDAFLLARSSVAPGALRAADDAEGGEVILVGTVPADPDGRGRWLLQVEEVTR